jgi:hypothetical protein
MSEHARSADRSPTGLRLLITAVVVLLLGALLFLVVSVTATNRKAELEQAWAESLGSFEDLVDRHPPRTANATAHEVERLAAAIGIEIAPRSGPQRHPLGPDAEQRFGAAKDAVFEYLEAQVESTSPVVEAPPAEVRDFLEATEAERAALTRHLASADVPHWILDLDLGWEMPIANLLGHINLQRVMAAGALAKASDGDAEGALADLDAAWRLNTTLQRDPVLIAQLVSMAIARHHVGVLRRIDDVPREWADRIRQHDYKRSMIDALHADGLIWSQYDSMYAMRPNKSALQSLVDTASRPYVRLCVTDLSESWRRRLVEFAAFDFVCDRDLAIFNVDVPWWNKIGGTFAAYANPNLANAPRRIGRYELDAELTAKLIELRAARRANGGRWPAVVPGIDVSTACPDDRFDYRVGADGTRRLEFSRPMEWEEMQGPKLPTAYEVEPGE